MMKSTLTYITILAIALMPTGMANASAKSLNMQLNMHKMSSSSTQSPCMNGSHEMAQQNSENASNEMTHSCCDKSAFDCSNCDNCKSLVVSAISLPNEFPNNTIVSASLQQLTPYSLLHGITQQNPIKPPRFF